MQVKHVIGVPLIVLFNLYYKRYRSVLQQKVVHFAVLNCPVGVRANKVFIVNFDDEEQPKKVVKIQVTVEVVPKNL